MKIYIPQYLLNRVPILFKFSKMIESYGELYPDEGENEEYYKQDLLLDPVVKFLDFIGIKDTSYYSKVFYTVKGTRYVLNYLQRLLGDVVIEYDTRNITLTLGKSVSFDFNTLCDRLEALLSCLLWYEKLTITVDSMEAEVKGSPLAHISNSLREYQKIYGTEIQE